MSCLRSQEIKNNFHLSFRLMSHDNNITRKEKKIKVRHKEDTPESLEGPPIIELGVNVGDELCFH